MGLFDIFTGGSSKKALNAQIGALNQGKQEGYGFLDQALAGAQPWLEKGANLYNPYVQSGLAGNTMYSNALGLNGADGNRQAVQSYQNSPGYDFAVDQALKAVNRTAAAQGRLQSGNAETSVLDRAYGLANQDYGSWLDRLKGVSDQGLNATSGQAGAYGSIGNLISGTGTAKANAALGTASGISNAWGDWANAQNAASGNGILGLLGAGNLVAKASGWGGFGFGK